MRSTGVTAPADNATRRRVQVQRAKNEGYEHGVETVKKQLDTATGSLRTAEAALAAQIDHGKVIWCCARTYATPTRTTPTNVHCLAQQLTIRIQELEQEVESLKAGMTVAEVSVHARYPLLVCA